ncbi:MAG: rhomboid family intramembrane serine protease [Desulfobacteraceae bacterium]|nr:rhomboid family intramembrane serine protease [Desulfobacteraceae bacterium]MBC2757986.1 rhomboid family intramembrane serine protease [Desulfobacteraceae bacterium]
MIPIRDTIPSQNYPVVNSTLIGINIVVFLIQMSQGIGLERFIYTYGLVPARFSIPYISSHFTLSQQLFSLISFMFLHGGFMHIVGNMWTLYIFGDNVEDRLGSFYYLVFYLFCGLMSGLFHLFLNYHSTVPTIGASGAIAGVMGAYFILYPNAKILSLVPIIIFPLFVEIPAVFFLGFWFIMQVFNAAFSSAMASGIAWWAHIGGFVFGIVSLKLFNVLPETSIAGSLKSASFKKKTTPRFQVLKPSSMHQDRNLYEEISITPYEATAGTKKMINIPWGFSKRFYNVNIAPGTRDGMILRLKGIGKLMQDGHRGDLLLKVRIQQPW